MRWQSWDQEGGPPWLRGERERPPWWPQNQPWPPGGRDGWQSAGRHVARRVGCVVLTVLLVLGAAGTGLVWLVLSAVGVVGSAPFARVASGAGLLLGIAAVALAVALVRRLTVPAERLVAAARRVESGDYSARVPVRGPGELRAVARAMNAMSARLEAEELRRRSVLADVAHELRTPLTVIRGQAEGIADGVYPPRAEEMAPILSATRTLEKLVDDLRTIAMADAGSLRLEREPVDVAVLVHETLDAFRAAADAGSVTLTARVAADLPAVEGDSARLNRALANVVANALHHTPPGGRVTIEARSTAAGVEISVSDDGEGIPAELLPRVFDRFVKGTRSGGSGLGLAIVRDIVEAHGGTATADSVPREGTTIRLSLPRQPPTPMST